MESPACPCVVAVLLSTRHCTTGHHTHECTRLVFNELCPLLTPLAQARPTIQCVCPVYIICATVADSAAGVSKGCVQEVCPEGVSGGDVPHTLEWLFFPCNNSQRLSLPTACHGSSLQSPLLAVPTPCSPHSLQSPLLAVPTPCSPHSLQPPLLTVPTPCSLLHVVYTAGATWSGPYCLL